MITLKLPCNAVHVVWHLVRCHAIHDVNFHVALSVVVDALFIDLDVEDAVCTISFLVVFKITLTYLLSC